MASTYALPANTTARHAHDNPASSEPSFAVKPLMGGRPRGRPRGESDLGRPQSQKGAAAATFGFAPIRESSAPPPPTSWLELPEALTALLIPLPYLFASLAYPRLPASLDVVTERLLDPLATETVAQALPHSLPLLHACILSSITLLSVGVVEKLRSSVDQPLDRRKAAGGSERGQTTLVVLADVGSLGRILQSTLGVLLPFYAALQLGGGAAALFLLVAVAAGLGRLDTKPGKHSLWDGLKRTIRTRKATCAVILAAMGFHVCMSVSKRGAILGHLALATSVLAIPPPLPTTAFSLMTGSRGANGSMARASLPKPSSPLVGTAGDTLLTLIAGVLLGLASIFYSVIAPSSSSIGAHAIFFSALSVASAAALVLFSLPSALRTPKKVGLAIGSFLVAAFCVHEHWNAWQSCVFGPLTCALVFGAVSFDTGTAIAHSRPNSSHGHSHAAHKHDHKHDHHLHGNHSNISAFLIARCTPGSIMHSILIEKDSRRIAYFGVLNLSFMVVQFFYGFVTGSLGLLTDSIHMLFDCAGLAVGLAAAVMSKWAPNARFPYGYGKVDTLSGFANGVFLMLVSLEIVFDASERLWDGSELHRLNELLIVSTLGFLVNIVGLTAFGHAHHGHGHSHDHGHGEDDHGHGHHHHDNENMQGIFLHILADALGSVAVIISTLLTKYYGWSGWDPIASCIIAILIFVSAIPLVKSSAMRLLLSLPADVEYGIRNTLQELSSLRGVVGYAVPKFWLEDEGAAHSEVHAKKEDDCGHSHSHSNGHAHGEHDHSHGHDHSHDAHKENSAHSHHTHDHSHDHDHHGHDHHNHTHGHSHEHDHDHDHKDHHHDHAHDHDHSPAHRGQKILGVIHIIASRAANLEDVRERAGQFLKDRGMDLVVHVEKEGEARCWCGGGKTS